MLKELDGYTYEKPDDAPGVDDFTLGEDAGIRFVDMYGVPTTMTKSGTRS